MILCSFQFREVAPCDFADLFAEGLVAFDVAGANFVIVGMTVGRGTEVKVGVSHHRHLGVVAWFFGKQTAEHSKSCTSFKANCVFRIYHFC